MFQSEIMVLIIVFLVLLSILTIMFLYLIIKKTIEISREKQIDLVIRQNSGPLYQFLYGGQDVTPLVPSTSIEFTALERSLNEYTAVVEGEGKERITVLANQLFTAYYSRQLENRKYSTRINVLYKIDGFQMNTLGEQLKKMAEEENVSKEEKLIIFRCLANSSDSEMFQMIKKMPFTFSILEYRSLLNRMKEDFFKRCSEHFHEYPLNLQMALIDMIGLRKELDQLKLLERLSESDDSEIRIRSLKAIGEIGYLSNPSILTRFTDSERWEERMMAAKVIGKTKCEDAIEWLDTLIEDKNWLVRSQSAQSYLSFSDGIERLRRIKQTSNDFFAQDMAREWLERGENHGAAAE